MSYPYINDCTPLNPDGTYNNSVGEWVYNEDLNAGNKYNEDGTVYTPLTYGWRCNENNDPDTVNDFKDLTVYVTDKDDWNKWYYISCLSDGNSYSREYGTTNRYRYGYEDGSVPDGCVNPASPDYVNPNACLQYEMSDCTYPFSSECEMGPQDSCNFDNQTSWQVFYYSPDAPDQFIQLNQPYPWDTDFNDEFTSDDGWARLSDLPLSCNSDSCYILPVHGNISTVIRTEDCASPGEDDDWYNNGNNNYQDCTPISSPGALKITNVRKLDYDSNENIYNQWYYGYYFRSYAYKKLTLDVASEYTLLYSVLNGLNVSEKTLTEEGYPRFFILEEDTFESYLYDASERGGEALYNDIFTETAFNGREMHSYALGGKGYKYFYENSIIKFEFIDKTSSDEGIPSFPKLNEQHTFTLYDKVENFIGSEDRTFYLVIGNPLSVPYIERVDMDLGYGWNEWDGDYSYVDVGKYYKIWNPGNQPYMEDTLYYDNIDVRLSNTMSFDCNSDLNGTAYCDNQCDINGVVYGPDHVIDNENCLCVGGNTGINPADGIDIRYQICYGGYWCDCEFDQTAVGYAHNGGYINCNSELRSYCAQSTIDPEYPAGESIEGWRCSLDYTGREYCKGVTGTDDCGRTYANNDIYGGDHVNIVYGGYSYTYYGYPCDMHGRCSPCDRFDVCDDNIPCKESFLDGYDASYPSKVCDEDDNGCGCFAPEPTLYHLDANGDCFQQVDGVYIAIPNANCNWSDETRYFCSAHGEPFLGDHYDYDIGPYEYQPFGWVNISGLTDNGEPDDSSLMGGNCIDPNASNYMSPGNCNYSESTGDVVIRFNFFDNLNRLKSVHSTVQFCYENGGCLDMNECGFADNEKYKLNGDGHECHKIILNNKTAGDVISYYMKVILNNSEIVEDGIVRKISVIGSIPTYINYEHIEYFFNYKNKFIESNLPIIGITVDSDVYPSSGEIEYIVWNDVDEISTIYEGRESKNQVNIQFESMVSTNVVDARYKMNYDIKLQSSESIFNLSASSRWKFNSVSNDNTYIKSQLVYEIWELMDMTSTVGKFIELIVNDEYQGVYLINSETEVGLDTNSSLVTTEIQMKSGCNTDGCVDENNNEYISFYNTTNSELNLDAYSFTNTSSSGDIRDDVFKFCHDSELYGWDDSSSEFITMDNCTLPSESTIVAYNSSKYGVCDNEVGNCLTDVDCIVPNNGCTCEPDGTNCYPPGYPDWDADNVQDDNMYVTSFTINEDGIIVEGGGVDECLIEDIKNKEPELKIRCHSPHSFSRGQEVYLNADEFQSDMTGVYYVCNIGDNFGGHGGDDLNLCCHEDSPINSSTCYNSCNGDIGICTNTLPTDGTSFYVQNFGNIIGNMGNEDAVVIYNDDELVSEVWYCDNCTNGLSGNPMSGNNGSWENASGDRPFQLKSPDCVPNQSTSWYGDDTTPSPGYSEFDDDPLCVTHGENFIIEVSISQISESGWISLDSLTYFNYINIIEGETDTVMDTLSIIDSKLSADNFDDMHKGSFAEYFLLSELLMSPSMYSRFKLIYYGGELRFDIPNNVYNGFKYIPSIESSACEIFIDNYINRVDNDHIGWVHSVNEYDGLIRKMFDSTKGGYPMDMYMVIKWNNRRNDEINPDKLDNRIDFYNDYLRNSIKIDNNRWNFTDDRYNDIINKLKSWIHNRILWMDKNIKYLAKSTYISEPNPYDELDCISTVDFYDDMNFCGDLEGGATNYNSQSNFNDGGCIYYKNKQLVFRLDTKYVNYPPIESVNIYISKLNGEVVTDKYELTEIIDDVWEIKLSKFKIGDVIEMSFEKITPDVYTVHTGRFEHDKVRTIVVSDMNTEYFTYYFNDFIDTLDRSTLPIIKIDTINYNDYGDIYDTDNPIVNINGTNKWYCPGYIDPVKNLIDDDSEDELSLYNNGSFPINYEIYDFCTIDPENGNGYFDTKELCQIDGCNIDCIDGTNIMDEPKISGHIDIIYNGENSMNIIHDDPQLSTKVGIEVRGFSSRGFAKKQYSIELQVDEPSPQCNGTAESENYNVFCNGFNPNPEEDYGDNCVFNRENDFVLLGPYRDRTFMRNVFSYRQWSDMGNITSDTKFVEFVLNGVYMGLYVFMEKVKDDKYRIPLTTTMEDDPNGGFIIKVESAGEQNFFVGFDGYTKFEYYEPKYNPNLDDESDSSSLISREVIKLERYVLENRYYDTIVQDVYEHTYGCYDTETIPDVWVCLDSYGDPYTWGDPYPHAYHECGNNEPETYCVDLDYWDEEDGCGEIAASGFPTYPNPPQLSCQSGPKYMKVSEFPYGIDDFNLPEPDSENQSELQMFIDSNMKVTYSGVMLATSHGYRYSPWSNYDNGSANSPHISDPDGGLHVRNTTYVSNYYGGCTDDWTTSDIATRLLGYDNYQADGDFILFQNCCYTVNSDGTPTTPEKCWRYLEDLNMYHFIGGYSQCEGDDTRHYNTHCSSDIDCDCTFIPVTGDASDINLSRVVIIADTRLINVGEGESISDYMLNSVEDGGPWYFNSGEDACASLNIEDVTGITDFNTTVCDNTNVGEECGSTSTEFPYMMEDPDNIDTEWVDNVLYGNGYCRSKTEIVDESFVGYEFTNWDNLKNKFDYNSFADYFISQEFARNNEGFTRSQYWYTHGIHEFDPNQSGCTDDCTDYRLYMGPVWDFNHSYAATLKDTEGWSIDTFFAIPEMWKKLLSIPEFSTVINDRWRRASKLPNSPYNIKNMMNRIDSILHELLLTKSIDRDHQRWYQKGTLGYENDIEIFKKFILDRYAWIDGHICGGDILLHEDNPYIWQGGILPDPYSDTEPIIGVDYHDHCYFNHNDHGTYYTCSKNGGLYYDDNVCSDECDIDEICNRVNIYDSWVYIYSPYEDKQINLLDDDYIDFKFGMSYDILHSIGVGESDKSIKFTIRNSYTREIIHEFIPSIDEYINGVYRWDLNRYNDDEIRGTLEISGLVNIINSYVGGDINSVYTNFKTPLKFNISVESSIGGCIDTTAVNYNIFAEVNDGSCRYEFDCDEKYLGGSSINSEVIIISRGYNTLSFPFDFSTRGIGLFNTLNESYLKDGDVYPGNFTENDFVLSFFNDKVYSAVFMNGRWESNSNDNVDMNNIQPGMGIILNVNKPGTIIWDI